MKGLSFKSIRFLFCCVCLIIITGCSNDSQTENLTSKEKNATNENAKLTDKQSTAASTTPKEKKSKKAASTKGFEELIGTWVYLEDLTFGSYMVFSESNGLLKHEEKGYGESGVFYDYEYKMTDDYKETGTLEVVSENGTPINDGRRHLMVAKDGQITDFYSTNSIGELPSRIDESLKHFPDLNKIEGTWISFGTEYDFKLGDKKMVMSRDGYGGVRHEEHYKILGTTIYHDLVVVREKVLEDSVETEKIGDEERVRFMFFGNDNLMYLRTHQQTVEFMRKR